VRRPSNPHPALRDASAKPPLHGHHSSPDLVVLFGTKRALGIAVKNDKTEMRFTQLAARLGGPERAG